MAIGEESSLGPFLVLVIGEESSLGPFLVLVIGEESSLGASRFWPFKKTQVLVLDWKMEYQVLAMYEYNNITLYSMYSISLLSTIPDYKNKYSNIKSEGLEFPFTLLLSAIMSTFCR